MSDVSTVTPPSILIPIRCHYCSKFVHPKEKVKIGPHVVICWKCWQDYKVQIENFEDPGFCQMCMTPTTTLAAEDPDPNTFRMYIVHKDGVFQVVCKACEKKYVTQRADLYADTPFGYHERKLK